MWIPLKLAFGFLTVIPVNIAGVDERDWGRSVLFFPLVGILIGLGIWLLQAILAGFSPLVVAVLILLAWVVITGALHLDGLGDVADALLGGHGNPARMLEILKDSRSGSAGVVALNLQLLLKFACISAMAGAAMICLVPVIARTLMMYFLLRTPYARESGVGAWICGEIPIKQAVTVCILVAVVVVLSLGLPGLILSAILVGAVELFRRWLISLFGGFTGDFAGALCEAAESMTLLYMVMILEVFKT